MRKKKTVIGLLPCLMAMSCIFMTGCSSAPSRKAGDKIGTTRSDNDSVRKARMNGTVSFEQDITNYFRLLHLPALAVGVARGDSLIFFKGLQNDPTKEAPTADHIFPIASLTKTFTAAVLKQMEGEGKLSLQDAVSDYPNRFFTENRWDATTTLGHIMSQTSESDPPGTQFVYNGSKFNILFNVFQAINKTPTTGALTRPFTDEVQKRVLKPLNMRHTLLRYNDKVFSSLKSKIAQTYRLDDSTGKFLPVQTDLRNMESGPGYGMMSSVNDLARYSSALNRNELLTAAQYRELTTPFYPGSPYGEGWFTTRFEGIDIHWAYGYGENDASLLVRIPSRDLTLIMLAPCALPSAVTRLGYGNPFNSMLVGSFFRNFVQELSQDTSDRSRLPIEERFAKAVTIAFLPAALKPDSLQAEKLLLALIEEFPADNIWQTPAGFELMAASENSRILRFGADMADAYVKQRKLHPIKAWYAGLIYRKNGHPENALSCFEQLAWGEQFREQPLKFDAMMEVAKQYRFSAPRHYKEMLQDLVRFKEYINIDDQQYREAKRLVSPFLSDGRSR